MRPRGLEATRSNKSAISRTQIGKGAVSATRPLYSASLQLHSEFECTSSLSNLLPATASDSCSCCRDPQRFHRLKFLRRIPGYRDSSYVTVTYETGRTWREYSWECSPVMRVTPSNSAHLVRLCVRMDHGTSAREYEVRSVPFREISTFGKSNSIDLGEVFYLLYTLNKRRTEITQSTNSIILFTEKIKNTCTCNMLE